MEKRIRSLLALFMVLSLTVVHAQKVTPSKKYVTKELTDVKNFSIISAVGSTDVEYKQVKSDVSRVSIYGSDNVVGLLNVTTINGVLQISFKKGVSIINGNSKLKVIASSPVLDKVIIKGSADVNLKGNISGKNLQLLIFGSGDMVAENLKYTTIASTIKGSGDLDLKKIDVVSANIEVFSSGDVDVKGATQSATLLVEGSGDISASKLTAKNVMATVYGSGDISCYATERLDARVKGSGDISYSGSPSIVNKEGRRDNISGK